ncbi:hypothetical protein MNBD_UNCLBAC01-1658 [hydrothermal vent metagenome]|uniref:PIN domain-containing protein n=1 Tax=hydrothermal vent metagenome TaxID=652676 RepID=A0A3B1DNJ6_9ZZZZ
MNIFDTSSFYLALRKEKSHLLKNTINQSLIKYEIGNVIWKEVDLIKSISKTEGLTILIFVHKIFKTMNIIEPNPQNISTLATDLNITYYDASFIQLAKEKQMPLITEDKKLKKSANKVVTALSLKDII